MDPASLSGVGRGEGRGGGMVGAVDASCIELVAVLFQPEKTDATEGLPQAWPTQSITQLGLHPNVQTHQGSTKFASMAAVDHRALMLRVCSALWLPCCRATYC